MLCVVACIHDVRTNVHVVMVKSFELNATHSGTFSLDSIILEAIETTIAII